MNIPFLDLKRLNAPYEQGIAVAVERTIRSGRHIGGPAVEAFEEALSRYQDGRHVVAVSNGLDALKLVLRGYMELGRMRPGDEVIVQANTYIASVLAISEVGLKPVLVDADIKTMNLDSSKLEAAITERTRAIMPVHLYGRVCWDETMKRIVKDHDLLVIEDNAQGIGSESPLAGVDGYFKTGSLGHAAAFSFYPTKNLGAMGDAGAVATLDAELAAVVRALANYGSDRRYHNIYRGYNCRMDPIQATILSYKLPFVDRENARRREIAAMYKREVTNRAITICTVEPSTATNYHQLVARCDSRDHMRQYLADRGIGTDIHYATPPYLQPCYAGEFANTAYPVTDRLASTIVSLPIAPYLTYAEVERITEALNDYR